MVNSGPKIDQTIAALSQQHNFEGSWWIMQELRQICSHVVQLYLAGTSKSMDLDKLQKSLSAWKQKIQ